MVKVITLLMMFALKLNEKSVDDRVCHSCLSELIAFFNGLKSTVQNFRKWITKQDCRLLKIVTFLIISVFCSVQFLNIFTKQTYS